MRLSYDSANFSFASEANSFLLAASEIPEASLHYPIVFIGKAGGAFSLAVLVGLTDKQNLFVEPDGKWAVDSYVPAFVRRYPFVLLEEATDQLSVGFDAAYPGFKDSGDDADGDALFAADGAPAPLLKHAISYLEGFHAEMGATRAFADKLGKLGLLTPRVVEVSVGPSRAPRVMQGFFAVDPKKLAALPAAKLAELAAGPELGWIYLHLNSLRLVARLAARVDAAKAKQVFPADAPVNVGTLPNHQPAPISAEPAPARSAPAKAPAAKAPPARSAQRARASTKSGGML